MIELSKNFTNVHKIQFNVFNFKQIQSGTTTVKSHNLWTSFKSNFYFKFISILRNISLREHDFGI